VLCTLIRGVFGCFDGGAHQCVVTGKYDVRVKFSNYLKVVRDAHESMTSCDESGSHRPCGLVGGPCVQSGIFDEVYCSEQAQDSCLIASKIDVHEVDNHDVQMSTSSPPLTFAS
jgi:hypothetical protein